MRIHRFYVAVKISTDSSFGGVFEVADEALANQLKKVLRLKIGYEITIFNGDGMDHECFIKGFEKGKVVLEIKRSYQSRYVPTRDIWLCASIIKKDNFEWIVEKATELGVSHVVPILSERSEKKSLNMERLSRIVIEASEQSGRGTVPTICPIVTLSEGVEHIMQKCARGTCQVLAFHTEGQAFQMSATYKEKPLALFVGPEGGWSEKEVESFHKENINVVCLGSQVLRAETAVVAALAQFVF